MPLPDSNQVPMQPQSLPNIQQNPIGVGSMQQSHAGVLDQVGQIQVKNTNGAGASAPRDPEKRRLIQQQLVLLLHAYKCMKKEHSGDATNCTLPHCQTMKEVLRHMNVCNQGKSCQVAHCASSRQIIAHWRACDRHDCVICLPLKSVPNTKNPTAAGGPSGPAVPNQLQQPRWQNPVSQIGESSLTATPGLVGAGTSTGPTYTTIFNDPNALPTNKSSVQDAFAGLPNGLAPNQVSGSMGRVNFGENLFRAPQVEKKWHSDINKELRNHLVQKLVRAIFPSPLTVYLTDERMKKLFLYARKVEGDVYEQANNRSEYYHLLAKKIYKIQKELEEKRAIRMGGRAIRMRGINRRSRRRTHLDLLAPTSRVKKSANISSGKPRSFHVGDPVFIPEVVGSRFKWLPETVTEVTNQMSKVRLTDGRMFSSHHDHSRHRFSTDDVSIHERNNDSTVADTPSIVNPAITPDTDIETDQNSNSAPAYESSSDGHD